MSSLSLSLLLIFLSTKQENRTLDFGMSSDSQGWGIAARKNLEFFEISEAKKKY
jgi:hypothetical protein